MVFKKGNKFGNTFGFKKGYTPWNKGKTMSEEARKKISENAKINPNFGMKGMHHSLETRKRISEKIKLRWKVNSNYGMKGRKHSEEAKRKMSVANIGKIISKEIKGKISKSNKGKIVSKKTRIKISKTLMGHGVSKEARRKMRIGTLNYLKNTKNIVPSLGKNEEKILNYLEAQMKLKIDRQFKCAGYSVDGYIPELNLCIEVDEPQHQRMKEKDTIRENNIKQELNCDFLRIDEQQYLQQMNGEKV